MALRIEKAFGVEPMLAAAQLGDTLLRMEAGHDSHAMHQRDTSIAGSMPALLDLDLRASPPRPGAWRRRPGGRETPEACRAACLALRLEVRPVLAPRRPGRRK
jgi:hypothetical protein